MEKDAKTKYLSERIFRAKFQLWMIKTMNAIPLSNEDKEWADKQIQKINKWETQLIKLKTK